MAGISSVPASTPQPALSLSPFGVSPGEELAPFPASTPVPVPGLSPSPQPPLTLPTAPPPGLSTTPTPAPPPSVGNTPIFITPSSLLAAHFDRNADGFTYVDDAFRGTKNPAYASGTRIASGGFSGGALKVDLGGVDHKEARNMSGGWRRSFKLPAAMRVSLSFRYELIQAANYEDDEISQVLLAVDGKQYGTGQNAYIAQLAGDGNGGNEKTTGWQLFEVNLGTLPAGDHTFIIGGYNNQKSSISEATQVLIDDVMITATPTDRG